MRVRIALLHVGRQLHVRIRHVTRQVLRVFSEAQHAAFELVELARPQVLALLNQRVVEQPLFRLLAIDPLQLGREVLRIHRVHVSRTLLGSLLRLPILFSACPCGGSPID
ncbi:hypothetical protein WT14_25685 [Burkholderia stagnalis]|nr:hypothetical protein WT07_26295 [Burkholderia stagnalis]KVN56279.1 hypothetical protein WT14_25685 [Burkholderia stagnalis]KWD98710.1 hypothetical protein WT47_26775 [Burkholderia stagnalis]KWE10800.1 hypothetical protein WT48_24980 [Burkholderia stagnalis]KWO70825.1 hypothetical protein WU00_16325 [Burkholderia stagnalis]